MAFRLPKIDKPQRVNFAEACHLIVCDEPTLGLKNIANALKDAVIDKRLAVEDVPDAHRSEKFEWTKGLLPTDGRIFSREGRALFVPTFVLREVIALFVEGAGEVESAIERALPRLASMRGETPSPQRPSQQQQKKLVKPIALNALKDFLKSLPADIKETEAMSAAAIHFDRTIPRSSWRPAWKANPNRRARGEHDRTIAAGKKIAR